MSEFEKLVNEMRNAQLLFLMTRSAKSLNMAKQLEKKVDDYLTSKKEA